jgi:hypothetical protein
VIHEHTPHDARGDPQKMGAVFDAHRAQVGEPQKGFMHEVGRLQTMTNTLVPKVPAGDSPQLRIHHRHERLEGLSVAITPAHEQAANVLLLDHPPTSPRSVK